MTQVIAITSAEGALKGVIRVLRVETANGTMEAAPVQRPDERHHVLDVPAELLSKPARELHEVVQRQLDSATSGSSA